MGVSIALIVLLIVLAISCIWFGLVAGNDDRFKPPDKKIPRSSRELPALLSLSHTITITPGNEEMSKPLCRKCFFLVASQCSKGIEGAPKLRVCPEFVNKKSNNAKQMSKEQEEMIRNAEESLAQTMAADFPARQVGMVETKQEDRSKIFLYHMEE